MLNNPNWNVKSKSVMAVGSLADWLERKPTNETYKYTDGKGCLLYQYFNDMGMKVNHVDSGSYYLESSNIGISYPYILNKIAYGGTYPILGDTYGEYRTFGAALQRAREYIAQGEI